MIFKASTQILKWTRDSNDSPRRHWCCNCLTYGTTGVEFKLERGAIYRNNNNAFDHTQRDSQIDKLTCANGHRVACQFDLDVQDSERTRLDSNESG